ncbi:MAG: proline dehydrogenase [Gemmatimonadales bacterium]|jgi:proline dehydrogenase|nr:MAG: proline dehydrogenase [Gemmatimonadales bacterium]
MLRRGLLWLSERRGVYRFVRRNRLAWRMASRFVAGETVDNAVAVALSLRDLTIGATVDFLGESVDAPPAAQAARDQYLALLGQLKANDLEVNVSVKLTQMGFDIDEDLCAANVSAIASKAMEHGGFVRIDMESSDYTQRTLDFYRSRIGPHFGAHTGVVIQSALRRSADDVQRLIADGVRVRLCKGAYLEPPDVAFPKKADVDANFITLMERLLLHGHYPAIATHDERIIRHAQGFVAQHGLAADRFEFQMLYGVRRDLQRQLRESGARVRVYIPFGSQWYPYLMRRLAERPSNVAFMVGNILREMRPSS